MKEYKNLSFDEQVRLFESRGMLIEDIDQAAKKLEYINYYKLKELAYPFYKGVDENLRYEDISFNQLITRYYQDKRLRGAISSSIEKIEIAFKTRMCYHLGKMHGPYGYLKFSSWCNKEKYCKYYISEKQDTFKKKLKDNTYLLDNECIKDHMRAIHGDEPQKKSYKIPIWMLLDRLMFGEVMSLYRLMSNKIREKISNDFGCIPSEIDSWLGGLKFVRNKYAHNVNVIDLRFRTKIKLRPKWKEYVYISPKNNESVAGIADAIIVMTYLSTQINKRFQFNEMQAAINRLVDDNNNNAIKLGYRNSYLAKNAIHKMGGNFANSSGNNHKTKKTRKRKTRK